MAKGKFVKEFKEFISKGNVVDMAVGVVIGGAFGKIVTGLVNYIINPVIGLLTGGVAIQDLRTLVSPSVAEEINEAGEVIKEAKEAVYVEWGLWIQTIIDFLLVALCIFLMLKVIMSVKNKAEKAKKKDEPAPEPAAPTTKKCPYCCSEIAIEATRCPHCTSELPKD